MVAQQVPAVSCAEWGQTQAGFAGVEQMGLDIDGLFRERMMYSVPITVINSVPKWLLPFIRPFCAE